MRDLVLATGVVPDYLVVPEECWILPWAVTRTGREAEGCSRRPGC